MYIILVVFNCNKIKLQKWENSHDFKQKLSLFLNKMLKINKKLNNIIKFKTFGNNISNRKWKKKKLKK